MDATSTPSCCAASRPPTAPAASTPTPVPGAPLADASRPKSTEGQVLVPGGTFLMGDHFGEGYRQDGEGPVHPVSISSFWLDETAVTNEQFASFVNETGYVTEAEHFGTSAVFHLDVNAPRADILGAAAGAPWWLNVAGADWRRPEGRRSDIRARPDHPVVHVSWNDAIAYAEWAGKRLATEAEWEYASRGGHEGRRFPWGDDLTPEGEWHCNVWQGDFPRHNTAADGFRTTAPAGAFHRNDFGIRNMIGNVWEWCGDWFSPHTYRLRADAAGTSSPDAAGDHAPVLDPRGPASGMARVMRGGSFLCHHSYCYRYRCAARSSNTPDSSSSNIGFRCANDA